jgi:hypothetical protein
MKRRKTVENVSEHLEPLNDWATRSKQVASRLLLTANEMEAKGVPAEHVSQIRELASQFPLAVDRVTNTKAASEVLRGYAAEFIELAYQMEAAAEIETLL